MNPVAVLKIVFTLAGIAMLSGTFFLARNTMNFLAQASRTHATVVDLVASRSSDSITYAPSVQFTSLNGEPVQFVSSTSSNPPGYAVGQKVEVLYRPASPRDAEINAFFPLWGGATIMGGLGVIFAGTGIGITLAPWLSRRGEEKIRQNAVVIETDFQTVQLNTFLTVNGRNPFQILTQWLDPATGKLHVFKSKNLWFDPSPYIPDQKIKVSLREGKPKKYHVDVSYLPDLAD
ncbi:MAG: DUF3592 domain-containing protein [Prochlorococcaceae cyanobacterium]|jgi:hypothetical protein